MCEARVAADAIGLLTLYVERRCVAALGNNLTAKHLTPLCGFDFGGKQQTTGNGGYARLTRG